MLALHLFSLFSVADVNGTLTQLVLHLNWLLYAVGLEPLILRLLRQGTFNPYSYVQR
jgi:hypothetical protein